MAKEKTCAWCGRRFIPGWRTYTTGLFMNIHYCSKKCKLEAEKGKGGLL